MKNKNVVRMIAVAAVAVSFSVNSRVYANATISLAADDAVFFGLANSNAIPAGDAVYMGQFSISDAQIQALSANGSMSLANYETLISDFIPLSSVSLSLIGTGTGADPGSISASYTGSNAGFANNPIYVLVLNQSSAASSAFSTGAGQVGVYRGDATWTFPVNMNSGTAEIDLDNVITTPLAGSYAATLDAATYGYTFGSGPIGATLLEPVTVPEPSTVALVGMGLFGAFAFRRRSKKA